MAKKKATKKKARGAGRPRKATAARKAKALKRGAADAAERPLQVFMNIGELLTLSGAAAKSGRRPTAADLGVIGDAVMVAYDGRVLWCGSPSDMPSSLRLGRIPGLKRAVPVETVSLGGATVIPAFVESHTHLVFAGNRADEFELRNQGVGYQEIARRGGGILATLVPTRAAGESELARRAQARADAFVRQGVTTLEIKSGYALNLEDELKMLRAAGRVTGPRVVRTFLGAHAVPKEFASAEAYVDHLIGQVLPRVASERLAARADIFIEDGYFPKSLAERYLRAAKGLGFDLVAHADQLTRTGAAGLAIDLGARSADHLLTINDQDIERLAASEVTCLLLPGADLYMKCPYPRARDLLDRGARVALATDFNPGSCPTQDLALIGVLARTQMRMTLAETIVAYTLGGAYALGLEKHLGSLEPGKCCDFSVLNGSWRDLFYQIGEMGIAEVWRDGRRLN